MKKKIILSVVIAVAVVIVVSASIPVVNYLSGHKLYNDVMIVFFLPVDKDTDRFIYVPTISGAGKGGKWLKWTEDEIKKIEIIHYEQDEFITSFTQEDNAPYYIEARCENKNGKTVITYRGEITNPQTGAKEPYEKIFEYDFILTKNIRNEDLSEMKYFD